MKFSHQLHLTTVGAQCTDCHVKAAASTASTDNLWPAEKTCLACHDGKRAANNCSTCHNAPLPGAARHESTRQPRYPIRFSHKTHLALGNIGPVLAAAVSSGSYLDPNKPALADLNTKSACAACHRGVARVDLATSANLPRMADCLTCHSDIDPPDSCRFCHTAAVEQLKPANHTADFLDAHSRMKLDKTGCAVCHGRKFTCMGCH